MQGQYKICPRCQATQAINAAYCTGCGRQFRTTSPMPSTEAPNEINHAKGEVFKQAGYAGMSCLVMALCPIAFVIVLVLIGLFGRH